jgi:hypothetical protein
MHAQSQTKGSSEIKEDAVPSKKRPFWEYQINRVGVAMWKHASDDGTVRLTYSISRSYYDRDEGKIKRTTFMDERDLDDYKSVLDATALKIEMERAKETLIAAA